MKTKRFLLSTAAFIFSSVISYAQYDPRQVLELPKFKDIAAVKNRQPIVVVNEINPEIENKLKHNHKEDVIKDYEQILANYNDNMKYFMNKYWKYNSLPVLYKTRGEVDELLKDKNNHEKYYCVFCYSAIGGYKNDFDWTIDKKGDKIEGSATMFAVGYLGESPFYKGGLGSLFTSATDLAFHVCMLNQCFDYINTHGEKANLLEMFDANSHIISQKTLLIPEFRVDPKIKDHVGDYYPCKIKVVDKDEMDKMVTTGDENYVYGTDASYFWMVDCKTGAIAGYTLKHLGKEFKGGLEKDFFTEIAHYCGTAKKK
ncbi:MAG TPA: hypothetical protein VK809_06160 [Bacteroidia bacterium]|jgi:hypothetical protein|nr:hypothetical protein [Bacteroidia bacterium]